MIAVNLGSEFDLSFKADLDEPDAKRFRGALDAYFSKVQSTLPADPEQVEAATATPTKAATESPTKAKPERQKEAKAGGGEKKEQAKPEGGAEKPGEAKAEKASAEQAKPAEAIAEQAKPAEASAEQAKPPQEQAKPKETTFPAVGGGVQLGTVTEPKAGLVFKAAGQSAGPSLMLVSQEESNKKSPPPPPPPPRLP
ncbi:MAG: hypothetical protein GY772_30765, partial [bacterium]|nr:hypothetical protein [bacterium]